MKKSILLIITLLILFSIAVSATEPQKTITRETEFTTKLTEYTYDASEEIIEDGVIYNFIDITYQVISEKQLTTTQTKLFNDEVTNEGMKHKDDNIFDKEVMIEKDGYHGVIPLKEIIYTGRKITERTASHTVEYDYKSQVSAPDPAPTLDVLYHDEETNIDVLATLPFVKLKKNSKSKWEDNIQVEQLYRSIYEDEYLLVDGTRLSFNKDKPEYKGIEDKLLRQMRLDTNNYIITDSRWINIAYTKDGITTRLAGYTVNRYVTVYSALYSGAFDIPNMLVYDAAAVYEGELTKEVDDEIEYTVMAIAIYEEIIDSELNDETIIDDNSLIKTIVAAASGFIVLCGLVLLLRKRKKKRK